MTTTLDLHLPRQSRIGGFAALAMRAGRALEAWRGRVTRPLDRDELERLIAIRREAQQAIAQHGSHALLR
jgi:hypothetical protein